jgi:hypothetical protein
LLAKETLTVSLNERTKSVITQGVALLREGAFMAAHECFEAAWRDAVASERTLLHALAQLAASHHQLARGRARAAVRTWLKARAKLAAVGALSPAYQRSVETFYESLQISAESPRFIEEKRLPPFEQWPCPSDLLPFVSSHESGSD